MRQMLRFYYMAKLKQLSVSNAELIERMTSIGLDIAALAKVFNLSKRTVERRIAESPELKAALLKGRLVQKIEVRKKLYDMAIAGNFEAIRFWTMRFDRPEDNVDEFTALNDDELIDPAYEAFNNMTEEEKQIQLENFKSEIIDEYKLSQMKLASGN
jgi:ECF sigma factor